MCDCECKCSKPEKGKKTPQDCTPEQIRECHGDVKQHPCETKSSK